MVLPKTLVISSSFFSLKSNNGKTLSSFFFGYPIERIAQISFSISPNDPSVCENYYAVTISDVLKRRKGRKYLADKTEKTHSEDERKSYRRVFHYFSEKRIPFTVLLKNAIWRHLDFNGIYNFVEEFDPDVVFFQGFGLSYGYRVALQICKKYNLPLILELTDDYTSHLYPLSLLDCYNHIEYNQLFKETIEYANSIIVISPKMKYEYENRFKKTMIEMMNSVSIKTLSYTDRDNHLFVYAGNIRLNRWRVLIEFSKAIYSIDHDNKLFICTPDVVHPRILDKFSNCPNIIYGGSLSPSELDKLFSECSYVVHVEAFDRKNKEITKYSLSTKIPEYMSSGALLIAIGPSDVASIEYIKNENIGICVSKKTSHEIYNSLDSILKNKKLISEMKNNAIIQCKKNHSKDTNAEKIRELLIKASQL